MLCILLSKCLCQSKVHLSVTVSARTGVEEVELGVHVELAGSYDPAAGVTALKRYAFSQRSKNGAAHVGEEHRALFHYVPNDRFVEVLLNCSCAYGVSAVCCGNT